MARQQAAVLAVEAQGDGAVEALGQVRPLVLHRLAERLAQGLGRLPGQRDLLFGLAASHAEQALGRGVGHLDPPLAVHHQDRVGEGVDAGLGGALGAEEAGVVGLAVVAQLPGHDVERLGQLAQLVVGRGRDDLVQVPRADGLDRLRHRADRSEDRFGGPPGEPDGHKDRRRQAESEPDQGVPRGLLGPAALLDHVVLVESADGSGHVFDVLERGQEAGRPEVSRVSLVLRRGRQVVEGLPLRAVVGRQVGQAFHQLVLRRVDGDVALFLVEHVAVQLPVLLVLLPGLLLFTGEGELEG
jgi:hypothetical protein